MNGESIKLPTKDVGTIADRKDAENRATDCNKGHTSHGEEPSIAYTPDEECSSHGEEPSIAFTNGKLITI